MSKLKLPANYTVISQEEQTLTDGGDISASCVARTFYTAARTCSFFSLALASPFFFLASCVARTSPFVEKIAPNWTVKKEVWSHPDPVLVNIDGKEQYFYYYATVVKTIEIPGAVYIANRIAQIGRSINLMMLEMMADMADMIVEAFS